MPDQTTPNPSNSLYGQLLQRATGIGADPYPYGQPSQAIMTDIPGIGPTNKMWQSLRDIASNPRTGEIMDAMYKEANPVFQKLKDAGTFAGDRNISTLQDVPGSSLIQKLAVPVSRHLPSDFQQLIDYIPLINMIKK